jgi:phosphoribosylformylglycinamidine synthase
LTDRLTLGNPEKPDRLFEFKEAVRGIGEMARDLRLAVPSGNVSFYNETAQGPALPTPTVLGVGIVDDVRKCVTTDFKNERNPVYVVGETREEMGASALYRRYGGKGGQVPTVDSAALSSRMDLLLGAMSKGLIRSCHDISDGGLAVAISEMCLGGDLGFEGDLGAMGDLPTEVKLFSETNSRFVVEIDRARAGEFESFAKGQAILIGQVGRARMTIRDGRVAIDLKVPAMRKAWSEPLWRMLG